MSRPRRNDDDRVATQVRLPRDLHQRLLEAANDRDLSANYLMTRAIADFLDRLIPADQFTLTRRPEPNR
jgi:predicted HicB family RNase H-like nuclease